MEKNSGLGKWVMIASALFALSCESMIPDPVDPRLSMYTEEGKNVSSALVNDKAWIANPGWVGINYGYDANHYLTIEPEKELALLRIEGKIGDKSHTITFTFGGLNIQKIKDVDILDGKKIPVDANMKATFGNNEAKSGQIYFKHVTSSDSAAILSGTFGFTIDEPLTKVTYGRFDIRISKDNNFQIMEERVSNKHYDPKYQITLPRDLAYYE